MSSNKTHKAGKVGQALARLLRDEGAIRELSTRSGLSPNTLRSIASSGIINSYVTALALERSTDGLIVADAVTTQSTKGADFYRREPARSLLLRSFEEGVSIARLLGRCGLTTGDLWQSMNAPAGKYEGTKEKVRAALVQLNLNHVWEDPR